ncbi:YlbF family regulator, partial [Staphylococcus aureus]|uniref:YlbF family regulator n=1 Tax=Staphylococcus aureus TaxID=1280 RepID=UPI002119FCAB
LADMIVASDIYASFEQAKQALENNDEAHLLYQSFLKSKEKYDEVMRFGKYHPEKLKAEYKKKLEETKKALDEQVKSAITEFQNVQPTNEKMTDLQDTKYV